MTLDKKLLSLQPFIVKLNALARGASHLEWDAGREFFAGFDNSEVLDADIHVDAVMHNRGATVEAECEISGTVTVPCDRCLEDLVIPVETSFDETYVPESDELDLSQDVYDFVMVSLPMQRVHEEGGCNQETLKFLSK